MEKKILSVSLLVSFWVSTLSLLFSSEIAAAMALSVACFLAVLFFSLWRKAEAEAVCRRERHPR